MSRPFAVCRDCPGTYPGCEDPPAARPRLRDALALRALLAASAAASRAAYAAGRVFGAVDQVRDAVSVALLPLDAPSYPWRSSLRLALDVLRGADPRPLLRLRNLTRSVAREAASHHEAALRAHFENVRKGLN